MKLKSINQSIYRKWFLPGKNDFYLEKKNSYGFIACTPLISLMSKFAIYTSIFLSWYQFPYSPLSQLCHPSSCIINKFNNSLTHASYLYKMHFQLFENCNLTTLRSLTWCNRFNVLISKQLGGDVSLVILRTLESFDSIHNFIQDILSMSIHSNLGKDNHKEVAFVNHWTSLE